MKKGIIGTFSKLGVVIGLAAILTGATFAKANSSTITPEAKTNMLRSSNVAVSKNKNVSADNQANYLIGANIVIALMSAPQYAKSEASFTRAVSDLVHLITALEGEPEAEKLKKTLNSVMQVKASSGQVSKDLVDAATSYSARLNSEQHWYYASGMTVTTLVIDVYSKDSAAIKVNLKRIQTLVKHAPSGTSPEVIRSMQNLVSYVAQSTFATEDFNALVEGVKEVDNSVFA